MRKKASYADTLIYTKNEKIYKLFINRVNINYAGPDKQNLSNFLPKNTATIYS